MEKRCIGIDLHRDQSRRLPAVGELQDIFPEMEAFSEFVKKLRPTDEVAVEITGSTRLFHDACWRRAHEAARGFTIGNPGMWFPLRCPSRGPRQQNVLGGKRPLRRAQPWRVLDSSAPFCKSMMRDGRSRREPDPMQLLRCSKYENQMEVTKLYRRALCLSLSMGSWVSSIRNATLSSVHL